MFAEIQNLRDQGSSTTVSLPGIGDRGVTLEQLRSWAAPGSVDTDLSELRFLELYRTHIA